MLKRCFSLHKDTTPPQPNHTVTPTHIEPEQYNTWSKSTISHKLLKMDVLTFETCWSVNSEIIKQVTSRWSIFIQLESSESAFFCRELNPYCLGRSTLSLVTTPTTPPCLQSKGTSPEFRCVYVACCLYTLSFVASKQTGWNGKVGSFVTSTREQIVLR